MGASCASAIRAAAFPHPIWRTSSSASTSSTGRVRASTPAPASVFRSRATSSKRTAARSPRTRFYGRGATFVCRLPRCEVGRRPKALRDLKVDLSRLILLLRRCAASGSLPECAVVPQSWRFLCSGTAALAALVARSFARIATWHRRCTPTAVAHHRRFDGAAAAGARRRAASIRNQHPDVKISVSGGGSGTGHQPGRRRRRSTSATPTSSHRPSRRLVDNKVAVIGFAVVTNPDVDVKSLTKKQIAGYLLAARHQLERGRRTRSEDRRHQPHASVRARASCSTRPSSTPEKVAEAASPKTRPVPSISVVKQTPGAISYAAFSGTHGQAGHRSWRSTASRRPTPTSSPANTRFWSYEHMFTNGAPHGR